MKNLIFINGTMGAGKTATSLELEKILPKCVFLDGDWCWHMSPFVVTDETKKMVQDNIIHLLNNFLSCSEYENIIFCWVMHQEEIINNLVARLSLTDVSLYKFTITLSEEKLKSHIMADVLTGARTPDSLARSIGRIPMYENMNTVKINVDNITSADAANTIANFIYN